jgi:hypothetical protein
VHPLGLSPHNIVVVAEEEHWLPWLVPCPVVTLSTPCDLFGVDTMAVAALAPEVVRGIQQDNRAVDSYALGTLVAQALGDNDMPPGMNDEDRVEAQARGVLWPPLTADTRLPTTLCDTQVGEELFRAVEHCRQATPSARPTDVAELRSALATLTDLVSMARRLRHSSPDRALDVLQWVREQDGDAYVDACLLGSEIAAERDDHETELRYLSDAVTAAPRRFDLRRRRHDAAWLMFEPLPPGRRRDRLGRTILDDVALLKPMALEDDTTLYRRAAEVHLCGGDPTTAARELFAALNRDPSDLASLLLYGRCWLALNNGEKVRQTVTEARRRVDRMSDAQLLTTGEAQQWRERFVQLLS